MKFFDKVIEKLYLCQKGNLAYFDSLTQVHNRLYFDNVVKTKYYDRKCVITFVDVDNLKATNDTLGHTAGDQLLCSVVSQLKDLSYSELIRYGGDEFLVISDKFQKFKLESATAGSCIKYEHENITHAVSRADKLMLIHKKYAKRGRDYCGHKLD